MPYSLGTMSLLCGLQTGSNVVYMPTPKEHPDAGARIRARRAFLKKSRPAIQRETDGLIYTELQKRVEDGDKKVRTVYAGHLKAWIAALEWTPLDFEKETGVSIVDTDAMPGSDPFTPGLMVGYYGTVSAGLGVVQGMNNPEHMVALDPIFPGLRGRDPRSLGL